MAIDKQHLLDEQKGVFCVETQLARSSPGHNKDVLLHTITAILLVILLIGAVLLGMMKYGAVTVDNQTNIREYQISFDTLIETITEDTNKQTTQYHVTGDGSEVWVLNDHDLGLHLIKVAATNNDAMCYVTSLDTVNGSDQDVAVIDTEGGDDDVTGDAKMEEIDIQLETLLFAAESEPIEDISILGAEGQSLCAGSETFHMARNYDDVQSQNPLSIDPDLPVVRSYTISHRQLVTSQQELLAAEELMATDPSSPDHDGAILGSRVRRDEGRQVTNRRVRVHAAFMRVREEARAREQAQRRRQQRRPRSAPDHDDGAILSRVRRDQRVRTNKPVQLLSQVRVRDETRARDAAQRRRVARRRRPRSPTDPPRLVQQAATQSRIVIHETLRRGRQNRPQRGQGRSKRSQIESTEFQENVTLAAGNHTEVAMAASHFRIINKYRRRRWQRSADNRIRTHLDDDALLQQRATPLPTELTTGAIAAGRGIRINMKYGRRGGTRGRG